MKLLRLPRSMALSLALLLLVTACGESAPEGMEGMEGMSEAEHEAMEAAQMEAPSGPASVTFASPADGETVTGPDVRVVLEVANLQIVEAGVMDAGTGHHHIFVGVDVTPLDAVIPAGQPGIIHLGQGQTEHVIEGMTPGEHRLIAVVADGMHVPLAPTVADTIHITVVAPNP